MLGQRVITAVILVIILGLSFYFLPLVGLKLLFASIIVIAADEWSKLCKLPKKYHQEIYSVGIAFLLMISMFFLDQKEMLYYLVFVSACWFAVIIYLLFIIKTIPNLIKTSYKWLFLGAVVLSSTFIAINLLLERFDANRELLFILIAVVWITDSGAYFVGKTIGKHKFAPVVSPGKTWQGVAGGLFFATLYGYFIAPMFIAENTLLFVLLIFVAATYSVFGDLFESLLKRQANQKDSGTILPGHGGVLDRFDSMLSYTPIITVGLYFA